MATTTARHAVLTVLGLIVIAALLVRRAALPPEPVPASAPPTEFSAERAVAHVREIAQRPHPAGTAENARVREYLVAQLRALGLEVEIQDATGVGTRYPTAGRIRNVLARLPGKTPGGPGVVLMSHYDGVAGGPAAGDAAAGTAAILETLRALRAGEPLTHDVMAVITDGEEAGLLGAAAFVREHPWAKNVGVTLNFEARGTRGHSYMFETGPGNLDVVRELRNAADVSATSLSVTVYRSLPNDTDLSEMAILGKPALNFAFADGVERYHTAHDDVTHLDRGSLQHHGSQMLTLTRSFGNGRMPRPATGDAVFFDVPLFGLVLYPESWALPLTVVAALLALAAIVLVARREPRWIRDAALGAVFTVVAVVVAGGSAMFIGTWIARLHAATGWEGAPAFRGIYTAGLAAWALTVAFASWAAVRRWASPVGAHAGALLVWSILTVLVTLRLPGVSFLFVWPLLAVAIAAIVAGRTTSAPQGPSGVGTASLWIATLVAMAILVPIVYAVSAVLLGAVGPGGIAAGILVALPAWLLAPQLEAMTAGRPWRTTVAALGLTVCLLGVGMATVRSSPEHPVPSQVTYVIDADSGDAWLAAFGPARADIVPAAMTSEPPQWVRRFVGGGAVSARVVPRASVGATTVDVITDSTAGDGRTVTLRVRPTPGAEEVTLRTAATVVRSAVDGREIDTSRYRRGSTPWQLRYTAPPDSGIQLALTVPAGAPLTLEVGALVRPIPPLPGVTVSSRTPNVVTTQNGEAMLVRRSIVIPSAARP